ncbi:hypothetical protein [uncultured Legionella sp.]|uniref:hypothetical protein n=1 Tax=uncultured Legionella sp. TaxID=210934 RepID=UPI00260BE71B|nr:hypothetical protein [uncultured Legionella sp.]
MPKFLTTDGHTQVIIPLRVTPYTHKEMPTLTGSAFSYEAGTVLYGNYNMEYLLPGGDKLRLIANHNKKTVQLLLFTHNPQILKELPGERPSSLVADTIATINRYRIRSKSYTPPLTPEQQIKRQLANECINDLDTLLKEERQLKPQEYKKQEQLRCKVLSIIDECRNGNRLVANNPVISEGALGSVLYDAYKNAQKFQFNRFYRVSRQDQMDFSKHNTFQKNNSEKPCFVWDSEIHIKHNNNELDDALRVICTQYQLTPSPKLIEIPANRFAKLEHFLRSLWHDGQDWINYLSIDAKPTHKSHVDTHPDGISVTRIKPYYNLKGLPQKGYSDLRELVFYLTNSSTEPSIAKSVRKAHKILAHLPDGNWVIIPKAKQIILRRDNKLCPLNYFVSDNLFYPLPDGEDLYTLSQVSKRHLYLPERLSLRLSAFVSRIPAFFQNFYNRLKSFIVHDLYEDFMNHVHATHEDKNKDATAHFNEPYTKIRGSLHAALENKGLLANGQTLEEFIKEHINNSPYVIARANHPPSPPLYDNPLHRILGVLRHVSSLFIDASERNPMIGSLAMAAYLYGAGAVLNPEALTSLLTKLHLGGLISGIEPTQKLAQWISHGKISEAISASATLWQGIIAGGSLDKFFVDAVTLFKEDPGEIAIIAALALSLGYGITKAIPELQDEMGEFPVPTYAGLGGKGGGALYDIIMHPGDDWLLGTCKWLCKNIITSAKISIAPFFEWYFYGYQNGFINGWKKSSEQIKKSGKQFLAASVDLVLTLLTIPLIEGSALLIHVPFRGITNFISMVLAIAGNISSIGRILIEIAQRPSFNNFIAEYQLSPLYGFSSPLGTFSDSLLTNLAINIIRILFLPPFQLIKNVLILPLLDTALLSVRILLTIINPVSRIIAYGSGILLSNFGAYWDSSIGLLFSSSASALTSWCNWIDNKAGEAKQYILLHIEINRSELFNWAFHQEDQLLHTLLSDQQYYSSDPRRMELMPHSKSHCLLHQLLEEKDVPPAHYQKLFSQSQQRVHTRDEELLIPSLQSWS